MAIEISTLGHGRYLVHEDGRARLAYALVSGADVWVFVNGRVYVIPTTAAAAARRATGTHDDEALLAAPMPATVVAIHVTPGQQVARGDVLILLEAMKMELPIAAPRDGRIRNVACRPGELVQPGVPLIEIE